MNDRWTEIQFYFLIHDVYRLNQSFDDVRIFIKVCNVLHNKERPFNVDFILSLANEILTDHTNFKPTPAEFIIVASAYGARIRDLVRDTGINERRISAIRKLHLADPLPIKTYYPDEYTQEQMVNFIFASFNIKKVGVTYGYSKYRRTMGTVYKFRSRCPKYESLRLI